MYRYEMKATGRADLAANEKVLDLYTSNLQLEEQLHGVRREVNDAKCIAEKVWYQRCSLAPSQAPNFCPAHISAFLVLGSDVQSFISFRPKAVLPTWLTSHKCTDCCCIC